MMRYEFALGALVATLGAGCVEESTSDVVPPPSPPYPCD
jgi:hypothetical protein